MQSLKILFAQQLLLYVWWQKLTCNGTRRAFRLLTEAVHSLDLLFRISQKLSMSLAEWVPSPFLTSQNPLRKRVSGEIRPEANIRVLEKPAKTP
jgi:hypothetical protein